MCFQILGFDFMMDTNGKVYLLEVNHTPALTTDTPLDELIKSSLVKDTLKII
jgi:D-alanine-D-alanine ligase-like ATP-grasp enzyme